MHTQQITASDGYPLHLTLFESPDEPTATIIFNAATAIPQSYYFTLARYLSGSGYSCICWDYRGIGKSVGSTIKNSDFSLHHWGALDFTVIVNYAQARYPDQRVILLTHSIGGIIPGFCEQAHLIDGVIGYGVQTAYWKDWNWPFRYSLYTQWHILLPLITSLFGYFPGRRFGLGTDIPAGYIRHWQKRKNHPDIMYLFQNEYKGELYFDQFHCPMIMAYASDDPLTTPKAMKRMYRLYPNALIKEITIQPNNFDMEKIGHLDFFKPKNRKKLWPLMNKWLEDILNEL